jgi:hypothetical protein
MSGIVAVNIMYLVILLAGVIAIFANVQAAEDMGPAAFLWPPDRTWSAAKDNTPPCGSAAGVGNRTSFPLSMISYPSHVILI